MIVFDIEADGLTPTKIHVVSVMSIKNGAIKSFKDYNEMRSFFNACNRDNKVLIGHNIQRFDIPVIERLLDIKITAPIIDTLPLSWYLEFDRQRHGLEKWGEDLGVQKPEITDWNNLSYDEYKNRCEEDVKINKLLFDKLWSKLLTLYGTEKDAWRLVKYLTFKMDCAREQERSGWLLDLDKATKAHAEMEVAKAEKVDALSKAMPKVPVISKKTRPKKPFKIDGTESEIGSKWFKLLEDNNLPCTYDGEVEVTSRYRDPKPTSFIQIKNWLYSLGWVPETYKYVRNKKTGDTKQIPQISLERGEGICPSIKKLYHKEPSLELLDGLAVLSHRIGILKGFISAVDENNYVKAEVQGLTNTFRFKHAVCVNLPGVDKPYGEVIRGCLIAPEGYELCGSDMCSLEESCKHHYMWKFDKEYVTEMMKPDFDAHLDLAFHAKALTAEQVQAHKDGTENHTDIRKQYKTVNYGAVYGAGGPTIARAANVSQKEGYALHDAYWKRNWAVKAIPKTIKTKVEFGSMWLLNPVSNFWYSLRAEKDIFSTLNQGTGVYCFDTWVAFVRSKRPQLTAQFHDEIVLTIKKGSRDSCTGLLKWAIDQTNKKLKLNRNLDVDTQYGDSYSEIH